MPTARPFTKNFVRGLQTSRPPDGEEDFSGYEHFHNLRLGSGDPAIRPGRVRATLDAPVDGNVAVESPGQITNSLRALVSPEVWDLNRDEWRLESYLQLADLVGAGGGYSVLYMDGAGAANLFFNSATGEWCFNHGYALGGTASLAGGVATTDPTHVAVEKVGDSLSLVVDGLVEDQLTLADDLLVPAAGDTLILMAAGALGSTQWMKGKIKYLQLVARARPDFRNLERNLLNPRHESVLACYRGGITSDYLVYDESAYGFDARGYGTFLVNATLGTKPDAPVQGMRVYQDRAGPRKLFMVCAGRELEVELG